MRDEWRKVGGFSGPGTLAVVLVHVENRQQWESRPVG